MNIIVCVKQVPATNEVQIDEKTNTIIREGTEAIINPYDLYAIEEALRIKEKLSGRVTALSMGIPAVADLLKKTVAMGVDEAVLLTDRAFAGADTLATSYTLAQGINKIGDYDLIVCGKQATDGDTAQVGPELAENLDLPHAAYVSTIKKITCDMIRCRRQIDDGYEIIEMPLPAVITVVKEINQPRFASINGLIKAHNSEVKQWGAQDIKADYAKIGLDGSPTQVVKTFIPQQDITSEIIEGKPEEQAQQLVDKLSSLDISVINYMV